jgi:hypothetical protein
LENVVYPPVFRNKTSTTLISAAILSGEHARRFPIDIDNLSLKAYRASNAEH